MGCQTGGKAGAWLGCGGQGTWMQTGQQVVPQLNHPWSAAAETAPVWTPATAQPHRQLACQSICQCESGPLLAMHPTAVDCRCQQKDLYGTAVWETGQCDVHVGS